MTPTKSPLDQLDSPAAIHDYLGWLYRETTLVRRLLRLSQAAQAQQQRPPACTDPDRATTQRRD